METSADLTSVRLKYGANKYAVFALTFWSYVCFHLSRKTFSAIKGVLNDEEWFTSSIFHHDEQTEMQGFLDTLFLLTYAGGLYVSGILGDRYDLRYVLTAGTFLTAAIVALFGVGGYLKIHALSFYAALWATNGLIQSCGWPANIAIMGNWFPFSTRGAVFGVWAGNASLGNIAGTAVVAITFYIVPPSEGWMLAMVIAGIVVAVEGTLLYFFLVPTPREAGLANQSEVEEGMDKLLEAERPSPSAGSDPPAIDFWSAWLIPGVIPYSLSYASLKAVNYALFFWLPFYLKNNFHMKDGEADFFSMLYDVGQILGGFAGGYISDRLGARAPVVVLMMLLSSFQFWFLRDTNRTSLAFMLLLVGGLMGGPANLISSTVSADLGTHPLLKGNAKALSTVTGILDGTGSIGAAVAQFLVGYLAHCRSGDNDGSLDSDAGQVCNWGPVFAMFVIGDLLAALCLTSVLIRELRELRRKQRRPQSP